MPVLAVFLFFFDFFFMFEFILRQLFLRQAPAVLGRRDGSIRALRMLRFRNKTREVVIFQIWVGDGGDDDDGADAVVENAFLKNNMSAVNNAFYKGFYITAPLRG